MNAKQAAAHLRKQLNQAQTAADHHGHVEWTRHTGEQLKSELPPGLRFAVRSTRTGVNVTIEDGYRPSYVDTITGGDRSKFGREHQDPVVAEVERIRNWFWDGGLPGETKWGTVVISAVAGTTTVIA